MSSDLVCFSQRVSCVVALSDGRRVVSGSVDKTLRVWDVDTGECVRELKGHGRGNVSESYGAMCKRGHAKRETGMFRLELTVVSVLADCLCLLGLAWILCSSSLHSSSHLFSLCHVI
jgi:WD40 repeat protein